MFKKRGSRITTPDGTVIPMTREDGLYFIHTLDPPQACRKAEGDEEPKGDSAHKDPPRTPPPAGTAKAKKGHFAAILKTQDVEQEQAAHAMNKADAALELLIRSDFNPAEARRLTLGKERAQECLNIKHLTSQLNEAKSKLKRVKKGR